MGAAICVADKGWFKVTLDRRDTSFLAQWWWTIDRYTIIAVGCLAAVGIMLVMAASPPVAERLGLASFYFVHRQAVFLVMGMVVMVVCSLLPVVVIRRLAVLAFVCGIMLLLVVLVADMQIKGARRWILLPGFSLQPSEFVKPLFAVVTGWVLARGRSEAHFPGFRIALGLYVLVVSLLILQPDFGMTVAISVVWGAQMFLAGLPTLWIIAALVLGVSGIVSAYFMLPHVAQRINTFLDPSRGDTYQSDRALDACINGGFLGLGPGEGVVKHVIPDAHTDFIFAVGCEELGVLLSLVVVLLYGFIILRGLVRLYKEVDLFIVFAASGLLLQFGFQAIVNIGVALNLLPNTGMTLPFVSYGGSATLGISLLMGMLLAFTRKRYGITVRSKRL